MPPSIDVLAALLAAAIRLSGLPAMDVRDLPPVSQLTRTELNQVVCSSAPVRCAGLMAAFDTQRYRIVVDAKLDFDDPEDASFLVHEIVHVLQFRNMGSVAFTSCTAVLESEEQAYAAQNAYLGLHGRQGRYGGMLRFSRCRTH
ncbi:hypothetical protein [Noviherbaspirillum suwonense]|uniref:DUF4157 domain-containing protein n=1 Tax=Noviherbaspirillum suwonense TaxID=1224511 RepID=A0ABY1QNV2_9BURK|nr:hypothetical protein [Noviherbaspirillum suwonense]SMP73555.1 hypothetical protein SAMN06295970_119109 [Noviherbaspirillum suwonense]